ncbi:unnamed protein product [Bursaphelenchus xylophilus]|uniref:(pine wood nematode) hypothetical protein n=1 Tax=Bursaphelenchus xylophilus TaxID=6326 RepID=A0A811L408_BURXY|nr:unnamed protein product [Bursaphelenchus xylophilus]CAG9111507.1 unnamed protein product [Bursaphelenchus xylophilus]
MIFGWILPLLLFHDVYSETSEVFIAETNESLPLNVQNLHYYRVIEEKDVWLMTHLIQPEIRFYAALNTTYRAILFIEKPANGTCDPFNLAKRVSIRFGDCFRHYILGCKQYATYKTDNGTAQNFTMHQFLEGSEFSNPITDIDFYDFRECGINRTTRIVFVQVLSSALPKGYNLGVYGHYISGVEESDSSLALFIVLLAIGIVLILPLTTIIYIIVQLRNDSVWRPACMTEFFVIRKRKAKKTTKDNKLPPKTSTSTSNVKKNEKNDPKMGVKTGK